MQRPLLPGGTGLYPTDSKNWPTTKGSGNYSLPMIVARQITSRKAIRVLFILSICGFLLTIFYSLRLQLYQTGLFASPSTISSILANEALEEQQQQHHRNRQWRRRAENITLGAATVVNSSSELWLTTTPADLLHYSYLRWYLLAKRVPGIDLSNDSDNFTTFLHNEQAKLSIHLPVWPHEIFNWTEYIDPWNSANINLSNPRNQENWPIFGEHTWLSLDKPPNGDRRQQKPSITRRRHRPSATIQSPQQLSSNNSSTVLTQSTAPSRSSSSIEYDDKLRSFHDRIEFQMLINTPNASFFKEMLPRKPKRVLLTSSTWWWGAKTTDERSKVFDICPIKHCELRVPNEIIPRGSKLSDKDKSSGKNMTYESCDAALTHSLQLLPVVNGVQRMMRPPDSLDQLWIYYALESPYYNRFSSYDRMYDDMINWTATYRLDSDIVAPYDKWTSYHNQPPPLNAAITARRDVWSQKLSNNSIEDAPPRARALALISNCNAAGRLAVARELRSAGIDVDVFGGCGSRTTESMRNNHNEFLLAAEQKYHFFLAFENSRCRSYITEKYFLNGLSYGMIPVVRGATKADYVIASPPNSFIFADDFRSIGALAKYMQTVVRNKDLYNSYFAWTGTGEFMNTNFWCRLCSMLWHHDLNEQPNKWYSSIVDWWEGSAEHGTQTCIDETSAQWTESQATVRSLRDYERYVHFSNRVTAKSLQGITNSDENLNFY